MAPVVEQQLSNPTGIDAYKPAVIARLVQDVGVAKANLPFMQLMTLAILAGAFIALGGAAYTMVMVGAESGVGAARLLGGLAFSLGLILVVVAGAELFTGNGLMMMALVDGRITVRSLLRNWAIVYSGNLAGAMLMVLLMALTGLLDGQMGEVAADITAAKTALSPIEAFARGVLCNILVCLAIWLTIAARDVAGKILAIIWPVTAFVLLGFEHSVANMYLIPQGWLAGAPVGLPAFIGNLVWVSAGNILGGAGGVSLAYWLAYRQSRSTQA
jgi:formate/nitrite transporter